MDIMDVLTVILYLIGFCSLLFLAYVTARYMGNKQNKAMRGRNIRIIETISLGGDKRLHLIKAGNQYVLIATTSKSVECLTTVNVEEEEEYSLNTEEASSGVFDFKVLFEKYTGFYKNRVIKESKKHTEESRTNSSGEAHNDFKSNLGRLKSLLKNSTYNVRENEVDNTNEKKIERS